MIPNGNIFQTIKEFVLLFILNYLLFYDLGSYFSSICCHPIVCEHKATKRKELGGEKWFGLNP